MSSVSYRPAWVDIDLDAVAGNVSVLTSLCGQSALCVAVKANAYGHGAVQVATAVLAAGARGLGVALVEEGLELRAAGIDTPIIVFYEPNAAAMTEMVRARLTPVLYSKAAVTAYSAAVARSGLPPQPMHLHVDTGMHREGASPAAFVELCRVVRNDQHLMLEGVSTHFANADDPKDPFTDIQARRFKQVLDVVFGDQRVPIAHCSNTPAAILRPDLRMDMVRVGGGVYGLTSAPTFALPKTIRPVMSVRANVSAVLDLNAGESISYGQTYGLVRPSRVAVIPVGYADGIPRALSNNGDVLINGRRYPIAGLVTMDNLMVDLGADLSVRAGDEAVLLGVQRSERISAEEIAQRTGSNAYEVTSRMGTRLPRRFIQGGAAVDLRQQRLSMTSAIT